MSILHWNICGFHSHRNYLRDLLSIFKPQIICLQETFLVQPATSIPNYHYINSPHSIAASILIHHKTPYIYLNIETTIPCTVTNLHSTLDYHHLFIYHLPINIDFDNLHDLISQLPSPLMIVGDFNY